MRAEHITLAGETVDSMPAIVEHIVIETEQPEQDINFWRWVFFHFDA